MRAGQRRAIALAALPGLALVAFGLHVVMYDGAIDDTSVARAISYGVIMIALLAGAIIVSQQWWVGVGIPFGLAAGMEYLVRHSGTSDGLEILGEVVALVGGLAFVIPVSGLIGLVGIARWRRGRSG